MQTTGKNWPLIIGISVPIVMVILIGLALYIPRLRNVPQYDFVYATGDYYYNGFSVKNGKIIQNPAQVNDSTFKPPIADTKLYYYNIANNESKELTLAQAQAYNIDPGPTSPDGYTVTQGSYGGDIFFSHSDYNSIYIKGHGVGKKLNIQNGNYYYNFRLLGWVKK